jgi:hypothetical protein
MAPYFRGAIPLVRRAHAERNVRVGTAHDGFVVWWAQCQRLCPPYKSVPRYTCPLLTSTVSPRCPALAACEAWKYRRQSGCAERALPCNEGQQCCDDDDSACYERSKGDELHGGAVAHCHSGIQRTILASVRWRLALSLRLRSFHPPHEIVGKARERAFKRLAGLADGFAFGRQGLCDGTNRDRA